MKISNKNSLISAILLILAGIAFIAFPVNSLSVVLRIIGALVLLWEIFDIYRTVRAFKSHQMIPLLLINNFFAIICAIILLVNPVGTIRTLSLIIGLYLIITSGVALYRASTKDGKKRVGEIITSTISLIVGLWLVISPFDITKLTALFIGAAIMIKGIELLVASISNDNDDSDDKDYVTDDFVDKTNG